MITHIYQNHARIYGSPCFTLVNNLLISSRGLLSNHTTSTATTQNRARDTAYTTNYDKAMPQFNKNSPPYHQCVDRNVILLINAAIRDNLEKEIIGSFQAISFSSADKHDTLIVETIINVLKNEVHTSLHSNIETLDILMFDTTCKHRHSLTYTASRFSPFDILNRLFGLLIRFF
jgi:hypothetical protein